MPKKLTTEEFIERARTVHGDRYDYSLVDYKEAHAKVEILCRKHGAFFQKPSNHTNLKQGCPVCAAESLPQRKPRPLEDVLNKFREAHGGKYLYDKVDYRGVFSKIVITCPEHGDFEQEAREHARGHGCPKCANESTGKKSMLSREDAISRARSVHGNLYDYSLFEYKGHSVKATIICPEHGAFEQLPNNHFVGAGCPMCSSSSLELVTREVLNEFCIEYEQEMRFDLCRSKYPLPFDFFIQEFNVLIECQGIQHFEPVKFFGGERQFRKRQKYDQIKRDFAKANGYRLLEIPYWMKHEEIEELLLEELTRQEVS